MEAAGMATVTLTPIPDLTAAVGVPRIAAIEYPSGRNLGRPGDAEGQTHVLRQALRVIETAERPGTIVDLPFRWPESAAQARGKGHDSPPIAKLLARKPWLLPRLLDRDPPG
jgi:hypothetical protein